METMKARRSWTDVLKTLRYHGHKLRLLYPGKLLVTIDEESKIFHEKNKFKQNLSTNQAIQKILEGKLQPKENCSHRNTGNR